MVTNEQYANCTDKSDNQLYDEFAELLFDIYTENKKVETGSADRDVSQEEQKSL
jgi:hypothetical protein